mmetsp:Transcript_120959/g.301835  ORF Transcript_120959/g.301835 Transcript_120959/m.301835 type:complete len:497 (-) Transcript_120959:223-1713(-)
MAFACLCFVGLDASAAWVAPHPVRDAHVRLHAPIVPARRVTRPCLGKLVKEPAPELGRKYLAAGIATMAAWAACSVVGLSTHPLIKLPARHSVLSIAQALTPLPLVAAVFNSLRVSASTEGWWAMNRMTYRRLNLGVATSSLWLAAAAYFGPVFSAGYKMYPVKFAGVVTVIHLATAAFCLGVWVRSVRSSPPPIDGHYLPRMVRGAIGSLLSLLPQSSETNTLSASGSATHHDDPETLAGSDGRNEYALACMLFLFFAVMPNVVKFPLATVPTFLGARLSRAASAWTFLAAVAAYVLKDASQRGRIHSGTTFRFLRLGLIASSGAHLVLVALKLAGIDGGMEGLVKFYPGVLSCPKVGAASLMMHALVVFAALTPPPKVAKPKSSKAAASAVPVAKVAAPAVAAAVPAAPAAPLVPDGAANGKLNIGEKVSWKGKSGTVRFVGPTSFAPGEWIGVELDSADGMHNGIVLGQRYFLCAERHGVFAQSTDLKVLATA